MALKHVETEVANEGMDHKSQARFDKLTRMRVSSIKKREDILFLRARRTYLSEAQVIAFSSILADKEEKPEEKNLEEMTNKELAAICEERGIKVPKGATKSVLLGLISEEAE